MDETSPWTLTNRECWDLLKDHSLGRLVTALDGRPDIFPVNYVVANGTLVFRTAPGAKHIAVRRELDVAFEIDGVDSEHDVAWSVVLKGRARDVSADQELTFVRALPLHPMHPDHKSIFVRIEPLEVTGVRFPMVPSADADGTTSTV